MSKTYTAIIFCRSCKKIILKVPDVPKRLKEITGDLAHFKSFCPDKSHNTFNDCNLNIKVEWFEIHQGKRREHHA